MVKKEGKDALSSSVRGAIQFTLALTAILLQLSGEEWTTAIMAFDNNNNKLSTFFTSERS